MFINLTNHPSSGWSEEQLKAAHQYSDHVCDMKFPDIKPEYSTAMVKKFANVMVEIITTTCKSEKPVVHIMGEMTYTYHVVSLLKEQGITCVASTTERIVKMMPDGKKVSEFKFVQFREY
jgi:hypothetical protein